MTGFKKDMSMAKLGVQDMFVAQVKDQAKAVQKCNKGLIAQILNGLKKESSSSSW